MPENLLCFGDNANFLRDKDLFPDECVDLVYLDPPFNSQRPYNILFKDHKGTASAAQIKAFDDTWKWDEVAQRNYEFIVTQPNFAPDALKALMDTFGKSLGHSEMFAYLVHMATRLVMMHRVLKKTGSLYLHCDPTASHYLKLVLDAIFGATNFRNEIVWKRASTVKGNFGQGSRLWSPNTDNIFFYTRTDDYPFNAQFRPYTEEYVTKFYRHTEPDGRRYRLISMIGPGGAAKGNPHYECMGVAKYWRYSKETMEKLIAGGMVVQTKPGAVPQRKLYLDEGKGVSIQTLWEDVESLSPSARERLGYPTQKPVELLKRIIAASSNPGGVVMDPFCGCGTTIDAVETLNRENPDDPPRTWIGIDITHLAINLIKHRLARFEPPPRYKIIGEPEDVAGASQLAQDDRYQFQYWALGLIGARPAKDDRKKGADKGIDGSFNFIDDHKGTMKSVLVQVKSGHVKHGDIRDFRGVLDREKAEMGVFITLEPPTKPMVKEAVDTGHYHSDGWNKDYPRVQILTIEELLADPDRPHPRCLRAPQRVLGETFKEGKKHRKKDGKQLEL